uniref:Sideroflexin-1 n=1 Tax=Gasterosteus aculeatus aculeatus TaxID=481459 RepID=A0AAQ4P209_GASAC
MAAELSTSINIKEPRWDQGTFVGRAKHFFTVTDPRNILLTNEQLAHAHKVVTDYRKGIVSPGLTEDELWKAKYVFDSAFHPDTGEKMILIGRMSAQVPMNMTITGCMMTFYKTTPAVLLWQWINQSFNAIVNYTNRSGDAPITVSQLGTAYVSATTGAVATALGLNALTKHISPLIGRFVPFAAVAAANCINIPLMRQRELQHGIPITDENDNRLGESTNAAQQAISQVVVSRILMASPGMAIPPFLMNHLEKKAFLKVGLLLLCYTAPTSDVSFVVIVLNELNGWERHVARRACRSVFHIAVAHQRHEKHRGHEDTLVQEFATAFCAAHCLLFFCVVFSEVPMDECTYSSHPGGILPGVCHSTVLRLVPSEELHIGQPPGAGAAGENSGQPPGSGEGLFQQRAMSAQPTHPNTATTPLQARSSPLCQPSSFSVPKLSLRLLVSIIQAFNPGTPSLCNDTFAPVHVIVDFVVTAREDFSSRWDEKVRR